MPGTARQGAAGGVGKAAQAAAAFDAADRGLGGAHAAGQLLSVAYQFSTCGKAPGAAGRAYGKEKVYGSIP